MSSYDALAQFYDKLTTDVPYESFANFYEDLFGLNGLHVKTILDLACGTGTLTCLLSERGYEMIGVDGSSDMLSAAAEKASKQATPPMLLNQEMRELDLYGTVDAVICSLDGINYVCPEDLNEVFRRVWLFLEPGGVFIFDINTPYKLKSLDGETFIDETDDLFCVWRAEFDDEENACYYDMDIFSESGGKWIRSKEEHIEYSYEPETLLRTLEAVGFKDSSVYRELSMDAPRDDEMRVFITARKSRD